MMVHVNQVHVATHEVPAKSWLVAHEKWVYGHCLQLHSTRRGNTTEQCLKNTPSEAPLVWKAAVVRPEDVAVPPDRVEAMTGTSIWSVWPLRPVLVDIMSTHRPLLRHIPKGAVSAWTTGFVGAMD